MLQLDETAIQLQKVRMAPRCLASPFALHDEIDGLIGILSELHCGKPPSNAHIASLADVSKQMLKCVEQRYTVMAIQEKCEDGQLMRLEKVKLTGAAAVQWTYGMIENKLEQEKSVPKDMNDIKPLRQFRWLLKPPQVVKVSEWVRQVATACAGIDGTMASALLNCTPDAKLSIIPHGGASSSSSSCAPIAVGTASAAQTKKAVAAEARDAGSQQHVAQFFRSKSRRTI